VEFAKFANCTLFSVTDADLRDGGDVPTVTVELRATDDPTSKMMRGRDDHTLALGTNWGALHLALGEHGAGHPLGFLADGGEPVAALDDGARSRGRYFDLEAIQDVRAALEHARPGGADPGGERRASGRASVGPDAARLRSFLDEAIAAGRGIIVHLFA
jgi:hypothetical protein